MLYTVIIQPEAFEELRETSDYIEQFNPQKAIDTVSMLVSYFTETLAEFPKAGVVENGSIRKLNHKKYSAFYTISESQKEVYILHIVDLTKPLEARKIDL